MNERRQSGALAGLAFIAFVLLLSTPSTSHEHDLGAQFERIHGAVVTIRTFEHAIVPRDGLVLMPITDLGSGVLISDDGDS